MELQQEATQLLQQITPDVLDQWSSDHTEPGSVTKPSPAEAQIAVLWAKLMELMELNVGCVIHSHFSLELCKGLCGTQAHQWVELSAPAHLVEDPLPWVCILDLAAPGVRPPILVIENNSPMRLLYHKR